MQWCLPRAIIIVVPHELVQTPAWGPSIQWNLRTKDTLGTGVLSFVQRLSLSRRFNCIILKNVLIIIYG